MLAIMICKQRCAGVTLTYLFLSMSTLGQLFKSICWFVLVLGLCFENSLQIILTGIF